MARLTDEEFHAWCQRNKIEPETAASIQRIRSSEPERKVRGRASNVSGRYPIVLVSSVTGKPLAKPYATFLTDAYSRRMLACYVTFDPPSYRSAMIAFRLCVQRYGRLPQELVVDRGPEFGSVYFESLLSRCFVTKLERPGQQPHFGSVVERLFGTATTELLNQLRGNTQASKIPRQMTPDIDPKKLAVWTLERFTNRLSEYVYEVYEQMEHVPIELKRFLDSGVALLECPNCARTRSLEPRSGVLRFPSHDKRKTHTPNTEQRWAIEQTIWEVVGGESK